MFCFPEWIVRTLYEGIRRMFIGVCKVVPLWWVLPRRAGRRLAPAFKTCFCDSNALKEVNREQMEMHLQMRSCFSVLLEVISKFLNPHLGRIHLSIRREGKLGLLKTGNVLNKRP